MHGKRTPFFLVINFLVFELILVRICNIFGLVRLRFRFGFRLGLTC